MSGLAGAHIAFARNYIKGSRTLIIPIEGLITLWRN